VTQKELRLVKDDISRIKAELTWEKAVYHDSTINISNIQMK